MSPPGRLKANPHPGAVQKKENGWSPQVEHDGKLAVLARRWSLVLRSARRVRKVWRLETNKGLCCLKRSILNEDGLLFVENATRYLLGQGFTAVLPSLPTPGGRGFVRLDGETFVLYPWRETREADFAQPADLELAVCVMAEMHERSKGFIPYTSDPARVRWGLWPRICKAKRAQLGEFNQRAAAMAGRDPFCARYAQLSPYYIAEANRTLAVLADSPYYELSAEAVGRRNLCHHDFSARNLLIDPRGLPTLVDFDYCLADLRLHDLANLLLRLLRHDHWRPETAGRVLDLYGHFSALDERELIVLYSFLLWPQDFWQVGLQFFLESLPWSRARFLQTLRRKTEDRAARAAFLAWFAREYTT